MLKGKSPLQRPVPRIWSAYLAPVLHHDGFLQLLPRKATKHISGAEAAQQAASMMFRCVSSKAQNKVILPGPNAQRCRRRITVRHCQGEQCYRVGGHWIQGSLFQDVQQCAYNPGIKDWQGRALALQSWKEDLTLIRLYLKFQSRATNTTREYVQINVFSGLHSGYLLFCKISMWIFMLVLT